MELFTIGHSNSPLSVFIDQLRQAQIEVLADVRRFPNSRNNPQFNQEVLRESLAQHGITYEWYEALGGRRRPQPDSPNTGWENKSFQGYADYMTEPAFEEAFTQLTERASSARTAVMCSEAQWWRCHRRLIADLFTLRGGTARHLMGRALKEHKLLPPAQVRHGQLIYPPSPEGPSA